MGGGRGRPRRPTTSHLSPRRTPWLSRGRGPKRPRGRAPGPGPQGGRGRGEGAEAASTCEHRACSGPGPAAAAPTAPKFAPSRLLSARPACWAVWLWMASAGLAEVPDDRTSGRTQRQTHGPQEPARPLSAHGRPQPPAQRTEPGHVCWSQSRAHEPQRLSRERPPGCGRRPPYPPPPARPWLWPAACPQLNPDLFRTLISNGRIHLAQVGTAPKTGGDRTLQPAAPTAPPRPPPTRTPQRPAQLLTYFGRNSWSGHSAVLPPAGGAQQGPRSGEQLSIPRGRG